MRESGLLFLCQDACRAFIYIRILIFGIIDGPVVECDGAVVIDGSDDGSVRSVILAEGVVFAPIRLDVNGNSA